MSTLERLVAEARARFKGRKLNEATRREIETWWTDALSYEEEDHDIDVQFTSVGNVTITFRPRSSKV